MLGAITNALSGLYTATRKVNEAANNIANVTTPGYNVDLAEEAVNLKIGEFAYRANLATIRTAEKMDEDLRRLFDETV